MLKWQQPDDTSTHYILSLISGQARTQGYINNLRRLSGSLLRHASWKDNRSVDLAFTFHAGRSKNMLSDEIMYLFNLREACKSPPFVSGDSLIATLRWSGKCSSTHFFFEKNWCSIKKKKNPKIFHVKLMSTLSLVTYSNCVINRVASHRAIVVSY